MSDEPEDSHPIKGMKQELDESRSVFVGQIAGESSVYIKFHNGETETRLRLSFEAAEALRDLLTRISTRGLMSMSEWTVIAHVIAKEPTDDAVSS